MLARAAVGGSESHAARESEVFQIRCRCGLQATKFFSVISARAKQGKSAWRGCIFSGNLRPTRVQ
jgi:hypothetical protein